ncbi:MAG: aminotransferase class I/II-fold pyridoxal phosphate-dependent enzyme [Anaerolineaceae bacterium]|nr:aminotransferase class I/II-fold pyridoxal phosphate-dependent enzyme [Anaerolineaceae bacterium]
MNDGSSTQAVHAGEARPKPYGALATPILQTSTYTFRDTAEIVAFMEAKAAGDGPVRDEYGRYSNPTQAVAEAKLAALESAEGALLFASGMAAITTTMATLLSSGDHLVLIRDCYHRTREFALTFLQRWGIETTLLPAAEAAALPGLVRPETRLVFCELPTNPYLRVVDLARVADVARGCGALTVVDSTFATPLNLRPLALGADLVIHSATKYLGGHNDLLAGVVAGPRRLLDRLEKARGVMGGISNPHDAYLLIRGLKTLALRVARQNENGLAVARFLAGHPAVRRVHYPGLPGHPDHGTACRQMAGFGGVVSFELDGDREAAGRFVDRLRLPYIGPTLGGVESIVEQPSRLFALDPAESRAAGLADSLVRYALGIEDAADLIADLEQALAGVG